MSRRSKLDREHETEETFIRACWDALGDCEKTNDCLCLLVLTPTLRLGVFDVRIEAVGQRVGDAAGRMAVIQGSYPNGRSQVLGAYLFGLANSLSQMVTAVRNDRDKA